MSLGSAVAAAVEVFLVRVNPIEVLLEGIDERLEAVQELLQAYAGPDSNPAQSEAAKRVVSLAIVGTGRLRRQQRSAENGHATLRQYLSELNSVVALAGRLIDISANMTVISPHPHHAHAEWLRELAEGNQSDPIEHSEQRATRSDDARNSGILGSLPASSRTSANTRPGSSGIFAGRNQAGRDYLRH